MGRPPTLGLALLALLSALVGAAPGGAEQPGAYVLWQEVRDGYRDLTYEDRGSVELAAAGRVWRTSFETAASGGSVRLVVHRRAGRVVLWRDAAGTHLYDEAAALTRAVERPATELAALASGEGSLDAWIVPALLLGLDPIGEIEGASVDGPEPCGGGSCWTLTLSRGACAAETRLFVDVETRRVLRVEGTFETPGEPPSSLLVTLEPSADPSAVDAAFSPPATASPIADGEDVALAGFGETISVELLTVVARVLDPFGKAMADLGPEDFRVTLAGRDVPVVGADWIVAGEGADDELPSLLPVAGVEVAPVERPVPPRVVFFFQADSNTIRIKGHLRLLPYLEEIVASFADSPMAVVSFDSHLKLWRDFGPVDAGVREAMLEAFKMGGPADPQLRPRDRGELARKIDLATARDVAWPEEALRVVAEALVPLPGEKVIIFVGWGLGRLYGRQGVRRTPDFGPAVRALQASRTAVHVLDVTGADFHSLEVGLMDMAASTGGSYSATFRFPAQARDRLVATVTGRYVLSLDAAGLPPRLGGLEVALRRRQGTVAVERIGT